MIRKQYLLQCFLSVRALDFARNEKYLSSAYKIMVFKWNQNIMGVTAPANTELNHTTVRPRKGEENFRCIGGPSPWESISLPPDGRGSPLPPVSFFLATCFPKQPFILLPLREEEQEGLGGWRSSLVCFGGIIHCSGVTDHWAQDRMLARSGFQLWSLTCYLWYQIQFKTSPDRFYLPFVWSPSSSVSVKCSSSPSGTHTYSKLIHWAVAGANGEITGQPSLTLTREHSTSVVIQLLLLGKEWRILENWNLFCNVISFLQ